MAAGRRGRRTDDDLAIEILRSVRRILRRVSDHSRALAAESGLTVPQLLCLRVLTDGQTAGAEGGHVTAAQVSRSLHLSPPTVCRILDRLERAGHVVRERDRADRRRVFLRVTDAGRAAMAKSPEPLQEQFLGRVRALAPAERTEILRSLERIVEMMEAGDLDAAPLIVPGDVPRPE